MSRYSERGYETSIVVITGSEGTQSDMVNFDYLADYVRWIDMSMHCTNSQTTNCLENRKPPKPVCEKDVNIDVRTSGGRQ